MATEVTWKRGWAKDQRCGWLWERFRFSVLSLWTTYFCLFIIGMASHHQWGTRNSHSLVYHQTQGRVVMHGMLVRKEMLYNPLILLNMKDLNRCLFVLVLIVSFFGDIADRLFWGKCENPPWGVVWEELCPSLALLLLSNLSEDECPYR